ncbi:hypothetical protein N7478_003859 [Penicillium angulare]|uniref:uncharacterized protein n=1 Tax=Penicillium angulare TaxID=116970 RepID=UPI00253F9859|nr:uncharacterized protein N7478_003859 [Penicillium angulare]KAJ5288173.1 hypothetical protein N7478_003859 [Penicillium angulare]
MARSETKPEPQAQAPESWTACYHRLVQPQWGPCAIGGRSCIYNPDCTNLDASKPLPEEYGNRSAEHKPKISSFTDLSNFIRDKQAGFRPRGEPVIPHTTDENVALLTPSSSFASATSPSTYGYQVARKFECLETASNGVHAEQKSSSQHVTDDRIISAAKLSPASHLTSMDQISDAEVLDSSASVADPSPSWISEHPVQLSKLELLLFPELYSYSEQFTRFS